VWIYTVFGISVGGTTETRYFLPSINFSLWALSALATDLSLCIWSSTLLVASPMVEKLLRKWSHICLTVQPDTTLPKRHYPRPKHPVAILGHWVQFILTIPVSTGLVGNGLDRDGINPIPMSFLFNVDTINRTILRKVMLILHPITFFFMPPPVTPSKPKPRSLGRAPIHGLQIHSLQTLC